MQFDIDGKEMSLRLSQSHEATRSNGGSAAIDRELRAMDEARAIGREKDNRFGDFLGLGRTASGRLSGQLLKPFNKRIRAFIRNTHARAKKKDRHRRRCPAGPPSFTR